jgi:hypothetical protein
MYSLARSSSGRSGHWVRWPVLRSVIRITAGTVRLRETPRAMKPASNSLTDTGTGPLAVWANQASARRHASARSTRTVGVP